jgi:DNA adenine methylase
MSRFQRTVSNPPLKWAGGKKWLVPTMKQLYAPYQSQKLVELFVGGLAISLGLLPKTALLNDSNIHLINFYRQVQKGLNTEISPPMENNAVRYYQIRDQFNKLIREGTEESQISAKLFYYLNRTGFNGLCRFNNSDQFNVPFGKYKTIHYAENFQSLKTVLSDWQFTSTDFMEVPLEGNDFIYADPPYDTEFTKYGKKAFTWEDQTRLATYLAKHPGPVVVSNQATTRILELYQDSGFSITILDAPRRISCNGNRAPAKEILATLNLTCVNP